MRRNKLFTACCLLFTVYCFSQSSTSSPYSRYGVGEIHGSGFASNSAIGGTGIAVQNDSITPFFINNINPASYTSLKITVFEAGILSNTSNFKSTTNNQVKNNTSLGYISFGIPFTKWWGGSFGIMPYSNVGYKISDQQILDSIGTVDYLYEGSGGINKLYWGNAFRIKNFSAGVNASYLFGTLNYAKRDIFTSTNYLNTRVNKSTVLNDVYLDYGMQHTFKIDSLRRKIIVKNDSVNVISRKKQDIEDVKITLGATFALQSDISAKSSTLAETYLLSSVTSNEIVKDTLQNTIDQEGFVSLPLSFGAGIAIKKGYRWMIAGDYLVQKWSNYAAFGQNPGLKNSMKISLGAQFVPAKSANFQGGYWKKVQYRMGIKYYQTYLELQNTQLNEYSVGFGLGMPVGRIKMLQQYSMVNLSFELGQRGTTEKNLVKEQFAKVTLGFTINDRWFLKPKID